MPEEEPAAAQVQRSWLERLGAALSREPQDKEQLLTLLRDAQQRDLLDDEALAMIEGVLQVSDLRVRDIMVPRSQMEVINYDADLAEILPIVVESGHSRYPVIGENRDEAIGVLLAKDLLVYFFKTPPESFNLQSMLRPAYFIPESKRVDVLLREFRLSHNHMALVVDEYGGIAGLVTIEDVLEEIVGDIEDEYDTDEEPNIKEHPEGYYFVKALTPVEEFNEHFSDNISDEEFDTVGGLVMTKLGYLPKRGETLEIGRYQFKVLLADNRRIRLFRVQMKK